MKKKVGVVYVHGLAQKPQKEILKRIWAEALSRGNPNPETFLPPNEGVDLDGNGVPYELVYYADVFYGTNYQTDLTSYYEAASGSELAKADGAGSEPPPGAYSESAFAKSVEAKLLAQMSKSVDPQIPATASIELEMTNSKYEALGLLPPALRKALIKKFAMEAYYYLFGVDYARDGVTFKTKEELQNRFIDTLNVMRDKVDELVVISHSMGTMIAYDCLRNRPDCPKIKTLFTLGSPLGISEVQNELKAEGQETVDFPTATLGEWINVYDPADPICGLDPYFARAYLNNGVEAVKDVKEENWGSWRHTITHYLAGNQMRAILAKSIGL
jgi:hypothetical protein